MTPGEITIRTGRPDEYQAVAALFEREFHSKYDLVRVKHSFDKYPKVVAYDGDVLIGYVFTRMFTYDICELVNMLVAKDYRGRKIGTRLVAAIEERMPPEATDMILGNSTMWSYAGRERALASEFYKRLGYEVKYETRRSVVMTKKLR